jgi:cell division septum initiation protein DivIVA
MQLTELLDELEASIAHAYYIPLTSKALVDQNACLDLIDKIRAALPVELAEAQRIKRARERILAQAEEEAEDMRRLSRERLEQAAAESEAVRLARVQAEEIVADAEQQAREMAAAAIEYTSGLYSKLERDLASLLDEVRQRTPETMSIGQ